MLVDSLPQSSSSTSRKNPIDKMHALSFLLAPVLVSAAAISVRDGSRAAYFLDNNPAGASIVSLKIADDGTLSGPVRTSTGGTGLFGLTAGTNGAPPAVGGAGETDELLNIYHLTFGRHTLHARLCTSRW